MSLFSGPIKIAFGFGLGVIAADLVKEVRPAFRGLGRPLLKAALKSGAIMARESRVKLAEFRETLADVNAEVETELQQAPQAPLRSEFAAHSNQESKVM